VTTAIAPPPTRVIGWAQTDTQWLNARRKGISASDIAAILGYSQYATPWEVWADKTGLRPREVDADKEAIRLGVALEPWLLRQAAHHLGTVVERTTARLYAHGWPESHWRLASPDGCVAGNIEELVEAKTCGLASGFGIPDGWSHARAPLGYEFQCRWQMHVLGARRVHLTALVANVGLIHHTYERDLSIEADMVAQVDEWYQQHLVRRIEPPMTARDNQLMDALYPTPTAGSIALDNDPTVIEALYAYRDGLEEEKRGKATKEAATALLKRKVGEHELATLDDRPAITWKSRLGEPRWRDLVEDLTTICGWAGEDLDVDDLIAKYRNPDTRVINVKEVLG